MSFSDNDDTPFEVQDDIAESDDEIDFYAILNVSRQATSDEIDKAYKQRCLVFHPDRHVDEEDRREATKIFVIIRKAHETLTDPYMRAIYDTLGVRGINLQGWQIVNHTTDPKNIKREYEFLKKLRDNEIMLQQVHPGSKFYFYSSIAGLFQSNSFERFTILSMKLQQSFDCEFTTQDRFGILGEVHFNKAGYGDGTLQFSHKRAISKSVQLENHINVGSKVISYLPRLSMTFLPDSINLLSSTSIIFRPFFRYNTLKEVFDRSLVIDIGYPINPISRGVLTFNIPLSSFTISYEQLELNRPKFDVRLTLVSNSLPIINISYHKRYPQNNEHFEASCEFSNMELTPSISFERRLTKYSMVGCQILCSFPSFRLQAVFKIRTSLNTYNFRFLLCEYQEDIIRTMLWCFIIPGITISASRYIFKRYITRIMRPFVEKNTEEVNDAKKEQAEKTVHLMRETAEKITKEELSKHGLVIMNAKYGQSIGSRHYPIAGENLIDVTIPLQTLVNDSQLRIYSGKEQIPGFYDPCPGEPKMLKVTYNFHDQLHSVTITEDQPLTIPMRAHCITNP